MRYVRCALALFIAILLTVPTLRAQAYIKLNGAYAVVGVLNPSVELVVSPHSTVQGEVVYSLWKSVRDHGVNKPMRFGIFMSEYRHYFRAHNDGWYVGANAGMMGFKMSKPYFAEGHLRLENRYSKGYGFMVGLCGGYEYRFARRWMMDAFIGWAYTLAWYNGYALDGTIDLYPHRPVQPSKPDPFNGSGQWIPNKGGLSIGFLIADPARKNGRPKSVR